MKEQSIKCPHCGSDKVKVEHTWTQESEVTETLPCACDAEEDFAHQKVLERTSKMYEWGWLEEDGEFERVESECIESDEMDLDETVGTCACAGKNDNDTTLEIEESEPITVEGSGEWTLCCADCGKVIDIDKMELSNSGGIIPLLRKLRT
jgi:hypothetical protein